MLTPFALYPGLLQALSRIFIHSAASNSISWQATSLVPYYFVGPHELHFVLCLDFFYCTEAES